MLTIQPDRHGPIIDEGHIHVRAKDSPLNRDVVSGKDGFETFDKRFGNSWRRGIGEAGSPPLTRIRVQCKLRDDEGRAADIQQRKVHLARLVLEDAQVHNLLAQRLHLRLSISTVLLTDAKQDEQSPAYLANNLPIDGHAGLADPL